MEAQQALVKKPLVQNTSNRMKINLKAGIFTSLLVGRGGKYKKEKEVSVMGEEDCVHDLLNDIEQEGFLVEEERSANHPLGIRNIDNFEGDGHGALGLRNIGQRSKVVGRVNFEIVGKNVAKDGDNRFGLNIDEKEEKGSYRNRDKEGAENSDVNRGMEGKTSGSDEETSGGINKVVVVVGRRRNEFTRGNVNRARMTKRGSRSMVLGSKSRREDAWMMRVRKKVKVLKLMVTSPCKVMRRLRDGYVRMMRAIGSKGSHGLGMANQSLVAGALLYPHNSKSQITPLPTSFLLDLVCTNYNLPSRYTNNNEAPSFNKQDMEEILGRSLALSQKPGPHLIL